MKKILLGLFAVLGIVSLSGCKKTKESYDLDESAKNHDISNVWFNNIEYNETAINNVAITNKEDGYDTTKTAHFEVFLPKNIQSEAKMNILDIPSYNSKSTIYANYASTTAFSSGDLATIIDILSEDTTIKTAVGYEIFKESSTLVEPKEGFCDASNDEKKFAVLYVPMRVDYVKYIADGDSSTRRITLITYVIAPVYATTTVYKDSKYSDSVVESYKDESKRISFTMQNGAIK